jgi:hypothetical protein
MTEAYKPSQIAAARLKRKVAEQRGQEVSERVAEIADADLQSAAGRPDNPDDPRTVKPTERVMSVGPDYIEGDGWFALLGGTQPLNYDAVLAQLSAPLKSSILRPAQQPASEKLRLHNDLMELDGRLDLLRRAEVQLWDEEHGRISIQTVSKEEIPDIRERFRNIGAGLQARRESVMSKLPDAETQFPKKN